MKIFLFGILISSGISMVLALAKMMDGPRFSTVAEYKAAWRTFRDSRSGKVWLISYWAFFLAFFILSLDKLSIISLRR